MSLLPLLREVSRSFYLSIRLLPRGLREPVGLAYLLARATDTIADTATIAAPLRLALLARTGAAIDGADDPSLQLAANEFAALQGDDAERRLMLRLDACIAPLASLDAADRDDVRAVLRHIVRGQRLDIERPVLQGDAELREYTYLVAGCVGEFWTDICARHVPRYAALPLAEMRALGREFGCALQLVNILRDAGEDARAGRHYLPAPGPAMGAALHAKWHGEAMRGLDGGLRYALAVNPRRIRAAVALPALLGRRTLLRLQQAGDAAMHTKVKVPRAEVRGLLLRLALGLAGRNTLRREWENAGR